MILVSFLFLIHKYQFQSSCLDGFGGQPGCWNHKLFDQIYFSGKILICTDIICLYSLTQVICTIPSVWLLLSCHAFFCIFFGSLYYIYWLGGLLFHLFFTEAAPAVFPDFVNIYFWYNALFWDMMRRDSLSLSFFKCPPCRDSRVFYLILKLCSIFFSQFSFLVVFFMSSSFLIYFLFCFVHFL